MTPLIIAAIVMIILWAIAAVSHYRALEWKETALNGISIQHELLRQLSQAQKNDTPRDPKTGRFVRR